MIFDAPPVRLATAAAYTLYMCQRAMFDKAIGKSDEHVRDLAKEWALGLGGRMQIEIRATGFDAVDWSKPYVVMANHQSYLDVLALFSALPKTVGVVAKNMAFPLAGGVVGRLVPAIADDDVEFAVLVDIGDADAFGAEVRVEDDLLPGNLDRLLVARVGIEADGRQGNEESGQEPTAAFHDVPSNVARWKFTLELWAVGGARAIVKSAKRGHSVFAGFPVLPVIGLSAEFEHSAQHEITA